MDECFKGWKHQDGNTKGTCCCNCRYHRPIVGHPWNKTSVTKAAINTIIGWGCCVPDMPAIVFFDGEHGMCEMHSPPINNVIQLVKKEDHV